MNLWIQTGTSRTPHVDNPVEIYAGLLYMRPRTDNSTGGNFYYTQDNWRDQGSKQEPG